jgi:hypothetical protein
VPSRAPATPDPPRACAIAGTSPALAEDVDLCASPNAVCFARLRRDHSWVSFESFEVGPTPDLTARVVVRATGTRLRGFVDGARIGPRPIGTPLVGGFFVVTRKTTTHLAAASSEGAIVVVDPGETIEPVAPLRLETPCSELTLDVPEAGLDEMAHALGLSGEPQTFFLPVARTAEVRVSRDGPVLATITPKDKAFYASVYEVRGDRAHVVIAADAGNVVGWVDRASIEGPTDYASSVRAPHIRMGPSKKGMLCTHDVALEFHVRGEVVRAGTIEADAAFDPDHPERLLELARIELLPDVSVRVPPAAITDCAVN